MRVIGVLNYKGGTGKTTTVVNVAAGLALRGARVLCVDLDAQGGLATWMGVPYTHTLAQVLLGQAEPQDCIVRARENLDIISSDHSLVQAEGELWRMADHARARHRLADRMSTLTDYEYVLLDFSPSAGLICECGLCYAQELVVPVAMNYMALVGTRQVVETLKTIGRLPDHHIRLSMIVPTFYDERLRKDQEVMGILQHYFADKVTEPIRADVKLSEAPGYGKSIYEYAPRSAGALDYSHLVERIVNNA
jgi:chromosome partitioning protein